MKPKSVRGDCDAQMAVLLQGEFLRQAKTINKMVAVTGYGQERDRRQALEAGFDHHLVKPVNVQVLAEVIGSRQRVAETR